MSALNVFTTDKKLKDRYVKTFSNHITYRNILILVFFIKYTDYSLIIKHKYSK